MKTREEAMKEMYRLAGDDSNFNCDDYRWDEGWSSVFSTSLTEETMTKLIDFIFEDDLKDVSLENK